MSNKATLDWKGVQEFAGMLGAFARELGPDCTGPRGGEIKKVLMTPAEAAADRARGLVPVVTGNLRDAIFATEGPADKPGVLVGVNREKAPYAGAVEFGTSLADAQPFFRPAMTETESSFASDIAPGIGEVIERIAADNAFTPSK
jgi:HK97 gp10 family phage protein